MEEEEEVDEKEINAGCPRLPLAPEPPPPRWRSSSVLGARLLGWIWTEHFALPARWESKMLGGCGQPQISSSFLLCAPTGGMGSGLAWAASADFFFFFFFFAFFFLFFLE